MNFFFHFLHRKRVIHKKHNKKGVRSNEPNGRTVQPKQLILISTEAEFCVLQSYGEVFFEFHFSFQVINFFPEKKNIFAYKT